MTPLAKLKRVRWGVRAALALGVAASITGNVLHAHEGFVSRAVSAWSPLALLITIELIARVPVHRRGLAISRWAATAVIAGIAAWVSYWHMAAVAARYGETGASPYLIPLSVDGLVVVASICLVELGRLIRDAEAGNSFDSAIPDQVEPDRDQVPELDDPIWRTPTPAEAEKVSTPEPPSRKPHPSSRERVERAHQRTPAATNEQLARRLNLSTKTVAKYRPDRQPVEPAQKEINGKVPDLEGVSS